ncbi:putative lipoprotein [Hyphomonas johnsonii MHS-2]|jgi:hypothetical protein|uniref:Putative lipoprotein n=2 Tax=Hyphomonas johnsonii TaxID=81031 RepID=A0A059FQH1_9PROT|nr:putative lipoprotein [Hyphomonas johnsonii MHS-2]
MVPGEATVESGLSHNQSVLRKVSAEYCDGAVEAGWVEASGGLAGLASALINGRAEPGENYAARIGAATDAPALVLSRISSDAQAARAGLAGVSDEARTVLSSDDKNAATRTDVMSYERALVRAQMAYRSFQAALSEVSARDDMDVDTAPVDLELESFAGTIDDARKTADGLADKYASLNTKAS